MENYNALSALSRLPSVDMGQIKNIDLASIDRNALAAAMEDGKLRDQQYQTYARDYLNGVLANNPNATGDQVGNALAQGGLGREAIPYQYNWINQQDARIKFESDLRKEAANVFGMLGSTEGVGRAVDHFNRVFPGYNWDRFRSMSPAQVQQEAAGFLGPKGQADLQHTQASTQATIAANQRANDENARAAELQPGKVQAQGLDNQGRVLSNQGQDLSNQGKQAALDSDEQVYVLPGGVHVSGRDMMESYSAFRSKSYLNQKVAFPDYLKSFGVSGVARRNPKTKGVDMNTLTPIDAGQAASQGAARGEQAGQASKIDALNQARAAIAGGADRNAVISRLKSWGLTDDEIAQGVR